jgi:hypothetical protein
MIDFKNLRPSANYPVYPPYHEGAYMEEYFYHFYKKNKQQFDETGYTYIPIFWTNIYNTGVNRNLIQPYLNALPPQKYFTVSQHDDAVSEKLPNGTLSFEAGGNKNGIPIPLICSKIPPQYLEQRNKDIFCSFVGSVLPGSLRHKIYNLYKNNKNFIFNLQHWTPTVNENRLLTFIENTKRSKFTLCPRGYGPHSFRLYEALQLKSIPVIIYDKEWFPFYDEIKWDKFSILIPEKDIDHIEEILLRYTGNVQQDMINYGQTIYEKYFTLEGTCRQILKILQR